MTCGRAPSSSSCRLPSHPPTNSFTRPIVTHLHLELHCSQVRVDGLLVTREGRPHRAHVAHQAVEVPKQSALLQLCACWGWGGVGVARCPPGKSPSRAPFFSCDHVHLRAGGKEEGRAAFIRVRADDSQLMMILRTVWQASRLGRLGTLTCDRI